jgi:phage portal protein BeeE
MFLLDPSDLGIPLPSGSSLTYANLEQRNQRRVQVALLPWIVRLEMAFSALLPAPRYVKFNVSALLRADAKTRMETHVLAVRGGINTANERRELEDEPPLDGGDVLYPPTPAKEPST